MGQQHRVTNIDRDAIDPKSLRRAVGQFATGVTIVTFKGDGDCARDDRATAVNPAIVLTPQSHASLLQPRRSSVRSWSIPDLR